MGIFFCFFLLCENLVMICIFMIQVWSQKQSNNHKNIYLNIIFYTWQEDEIQIINYHKLLFFERIKKSFLMLFLRTTMLCLWNEAIDQKTLKIPKIQCLSWNNIIDLTCRTCFNDNFILKIHYQWHYQMLQRALRKINKIFNKNLQCNKIKIFNVSITTKSQQYYYGKFNKQNFPL